MESIVVKGVTRFKMLSVFWIPTLNQVLFRPDFQSVAKNPILVVTIFVAQPVAEPTCFELILDGKSQILCSNKANPS
jgi:hypothetical protein